jgi:hypothetical protein
MAVHTIIPFQYGNGLLVTCARINLLTWYEKLPGARQRIIILSRGRDVPCAPVEDEGKHSGGIDDLDAAGEPCYLKCDVCEEGYEAEKGREEGKTLFSFGGDDVCVTAGVLAVSR